MSFFQNFLSVQYLVVEVEIFTSQTEYLDNRKQFFDFLNLASFHDFIFSSFCSVGIL